MRKLEMEELNRLTKDDYEKAEKLPVVVVLDNVRSLSNVGAVFRSADAFRVGEIFLCGITACPPHREIHKTALGADETVRWRYFPTTQAACEVLKSMHYTIVAVEQVDNSVMLQNFKMSTHTAFILGNEVDGVSEETLPFCDSAVEIPQVGTKHSLNVSVCAGIIMWEYFIQIAPKNAFFNHFINNC